MSTFNELLRGDISGWRGFPTGYTTGCKIPQSSLFTVVDGSTSSNANTFLGGTISTPNGGWSYSGTSGWTVASNAVFNGLFVPVGIDMPSGPSNVLVQNCIITGNGSFDVGAVTLRSTANVTIQDCTIHGQNNGADRVETCIKDVFGDALGTLIQRVDCYYSDTPIQVYQGIIRDNYIHDLGANATDHINGMTTNGSNAAPLLISHNTILNPFGQTDAIGLFQDFGNQQNTTIDNNLMAGGSYTLYPGSGTKGSPINIVVTNNYFSTLYWPNSGQYGPVYPSNPPDFSNGNSNGNVWSNNTWYDGPNVGQLISHP